MLVIGAATQNWQLKNKAGDTSFGFEKWYTNCHSAVVVTSDGQLGLIRPDVGANCSLTNPPTVECYQSITDWNTLRTAPREFTILWTTTGVTLSVDGVPRASSAGCITPAIPQVPLHVRLNANVFNGDRERLPGEDGHYDQDVLWVDYVYVPAHGIYLPIIQRNYPICP